MADGIAAEQALRRDHMDGVTSSAAPIVPSRPRDRVREIVLIVLSRWRVEAGFILGGAALALARPTHQAIVRALPVVAAALALRAWARGHLERRKYLTRSGPYAYVRHPLYLGSFAIGFAVASVVWCPVAPAIFTVAFITAYYPKALREEQFLRARYGDEYARYADEVGALIPRVRRATSATPDGGRFRWHRVLAHREWQTWIGAVLVLALLWARAT